MPSNRRDRIKILIPEMLDAFPSPFNNGMVHPGAFDIQADCNTSGTESFGKNDDRKRASMFPIEDFRIAGWTREGWNKMHFCKR